MQKRSLPLAALALFIMSALIVAGCATTSGSAAKSPRDLMVQAGFKKGVADQPGEIKYIQKVPSEKMLCYARGDQKCYAFKDPDGNAMYLGDEAAYKRYLDLVIQEKLDERHRKFDLQPDDPEFWNMWVDKSGGG